MPMVRQHRHPVSHFEAASGQSAAFQPVTARGLQLPARIQIKKAAAIPKWIAAAEIPAHKTHPPTPYDEELAETHIQAGLLTRVS